MDRDKLAYFTGFLSHEVRLHIIRMLLENGPMPTRELFDALGDSDPKNWHHLQSLDRSGLVHSQYYDGPAKRWYLDEDLLHQVIDALHDLCYNMGATK